MQNKILKNYQASVEYRRFQIGCGFVEHDLFNTSTFIQIAYVYDFSYKFDTVLY